MTPAEIDLARRFLAAGAPVPDHCPSARYGGVFLVGGSDAPNHPVGSSVFCGGLLYVVVVVGGDPRLLPLLTDPSWLGWVLGEVERRGYWWALSARGAWSVDGPSTAGGDPCDRPAALVAMLEATR